MTIITTMQTIEVADVDDVVITDSVRDIETGEYSREIRVLGQIPTVNGTPISGVVLTLIVKSMTADTIEIAAPASEF